MIPAIQHHASAVEGVDRIDAARQAINREGPK
jgi:hypothetical protein